MRSAVHAFLQKQAPKIIGQVIVARSQVRKGALTQEEQDALDRILGMITEQGWSVLAGEVEPILEEAVREQGYAALAQIGIDTDATPGPGGIVDARALDYARDRSAELVGMRRDALGNLVENPNAEWRIDDTTRDMLRVDVGTAIAEGWSNDKLAAALAKNYAFSDERAMTIARTETNFAASQGALAGYKASGVVQGKIWLTAEDDKVSEECEANGDAGVIGLDDDFPSGDDAPPVHPNCRCAISPVVDFDKGETADVQAETTAGEGETETAQIETMPGLVTLPEEEAAAAVPIEIAPLVEEAPAVPEPGVTFYGAPSEAFVAQMTDLVAALPDGMRAKLADKGIDFAFGGNLLDVAPELKGVHPQGWSKGTTWASAEGLFSHGSLGAEEGPTVVVSQQFRPVGQKAFVDSKRVLGVFNHETGHAFDFALDQISSSPEFIKAYAADLMEWRTTRDATEMVRLRSAMSYYLQKGRNGRAEAFAEVFAAIRGTPSGNRWSAEEFMKLWPNVADFIRNEIDDLLGAEA